MPRPRNVIQSFKKVLNTAPTSRAASTNIVYDLVSGVDSVAAGQTGVIDDQVPTGSVIKEIIIQYSVINLVSVAMFNNISIQHLRSGQTSISPIVVGGNPQRNQVHLQKMKSVGQDQQRDYEIRFKIPRKYQRVREGDKWVLTSLCNQIFTDNLQVIYKFYR